MSFQRGSMLGLVLLGLAAAGHGETPATARTETLAILVPSSSPLAKVLPASLCFQRRFVLADPKDLAAVLKEHPLELTAKTTAADVSYFGKLVSADFLLTVQSGDKQWIVRLVQTSTGKVVGDTAVAMAEDPFIAAGAVCESIAPTVNPAEPEHKPGDDPRKEAAYWREFARSLMPRSGMEGSRSPLDVGAERDRLKAETAVGAWEHVLMLEPKDNEALLNLGVCLVSLTRDRLNSNQPVSDVDAWMAVKGTELAEAAFVGEPNAFSGSTYSQLIGPLEGRLPTRALQMNEFIIDHAKDFSQRSVKRARLIVLAKNPERLAGEIEAAVARVEEDPDAVASLFDGPLRGAFGNDTQRRMAIAAPYTKSDDAVTRFFAEFSIAAALDGLKDPRALEHYDRMLEVQEAAYAELPLGSDHRAAIDHTFYYRYNMCVTLGKPEEAKATILKGAEHFQKAGRFNDAVSWVYYTAVIEVLGNKNPEKALPICETYLSAKAKILDGGDEGWARQVAEYQTVHTALLAGEKVPDFSAMKLIEGTAGEELGYARMAASGGKIWVALRTNAPGPAMMLDPKENLAVGIPALGRKQMAVAAVGARVYFGGYDGLFELNVDGQVVRHFTAPDILPGAKSIVDLRAAGDNLLMTFCDYNHYGVALLNPTTGKFTQLAPSKPQVTLGSEPVYDSYRVWHDAAEDQIIASDESRGTSRTSWTYTKGAWARPETAILGRRGKATLAAISQRNEAMIISTENELLHLQLKGSKDIWLLQPYVWKVVEPAWDADSVYLPTYLGLYRVSRATGKMTWLAHQTNTPAYSALLQGDAVYVVTSRGLYRYTLPK